MDSRTKEWLWGLKTPALIMGLAILGCALFIGYYPPTPEAPDPVETSPEPPLIGPAAELPGTIQTFQDVFIEDNFSVYSTPRPFETPWLELLDSNHYDDVPGKLGGVFCGFYSVTLTFTITKRQMGAFKMATIGQNLYLTGNNNVVVLGVASAVILDESEDGYFYTALVTADKLRVE
jgi:hypothetical protein